MLSPSANIKLMSCFTCFHVCMQESGQCTQPMLRMVCYHNKGGEPQHSMSSVDRDYSCGIDSVQSKLLGMAAWSPFVTLYAKVVPNINSLFNPLTMMLQ